MEDGRWKPERESVERGSPASPTEGRGGAMVRRSTLHAHMTVLPVIERELRMRARQGVTYWTRCGVAAMAAMVGLQELVLSATAVSPASLGAAVFLALAARIWVSARAQSRHNAMRLAALTILLLCVVPRIAMNMGLFLSPKAVFLATLSPFTSFYLASDAQYAGASLEFWVSICAVHAEGWVLLGWTAIRLLRNWQSVEWSPRPKIVGGEPLVKGRRRP